MFAKFFASAFTGSMRGSGAEMYAVWVYLLAHSDWKGFVEVNFQDIGDRIGMKKEAVEAVVDRLCQPDSKSRSKADGGRRLIRQGEYLYFVVNHEHYRAIRQQEERREKQREYQADYRARGKKPKKGNPLPGEPEYDRIHREEGQQAADAALDAIKEGPTTNQTMSECQPVAESVATGQAEGATPPQKSP